MAKIATLLLLCAGLACPDGARAADEKELRLTVAAPAQGAVIGQPDGRVFVSGRVLTRAGHAQQYDVILVIDTSFSTHAPSGADVDGDGKRGRRYLERIFPPISWIFPVGNTDAGDSILAAEVEAALTLLEQLDSRTTRVGVVAFAGDANDASADARTIVPLTDRYQSVERGLRLILNDGPRGRTNMYDAVLVASSELAGYNTAISTQRDDPDEARRIVLFMTDGRPTLPMVQRPMENARLAIEEARRATLWDIRIDTFAIGPKATKEPVVAVEMAAVTKGVFTPVKNPRDLIAVFEKIQFADVERVDIRNRTTGVEADSVLVDADGSFAAFVPLQDGKNRLEVRAVDSDGAEGRAMVDVIRFAHAPAPLLAPRLEARRLRLLETQLAELKRRNVEIEVARDEQVRRDLEVAIEEARAKRAASRSLEVAVDDAVPASPAR